MAVVSCRTIDSLIDHYLHHHTAPQIYSTISSTNFFPFFAGDEDKVLLEQLSMAYHVALALALFFIRSTLSNSLMSS